MENVIRVQILNNVYMRVLSTPEITVELLDFFAYESPGGKFTKEYKAKQWDGMVYLYDAIKKTLYLGLMPYLKKFAEDNGYTLSIKNPVPKNEIIPMDELVSWAKGLEPHDSKKKPIGLRDYQKVGLFIAINQKRRTLVSPPGSGKSLMIYCILRRLIENNPDRKNIVVVPSTGLVEQLYKDFGDYSWKNGWDVDKYVQKLYFGFPKKMEKTVLITTWQSVYKQPRNWFDQFEVIIGDEAHTFRSDSLRNMISKTGKADYRIGTTGTMHDAKIHYLMIEGIFGMGKDLTTNRELMDRKQLSELKITCIRLKYSDKVREYMRAMKKQTMKGFERFLYFKEIDFLTAYERRNKYICALANKLEGNTLILFQYVDKHGIPLYEMMKKRVEESEQDKEVFFIYGKVKTKEREQVRKILNENRNCILIASYGTFSVGVNAPSLENIILASPSKSKIRILQSAGRGTRVEEHKINCKMFDLIDDMQTPEWENYAIKHAKKRMRMYKKEKFDYRIVEAEIGE